MPELVPISASGPKKELWDERLLVKREKCVFCGSSGGLPRAYRQDGLLISECDQCGLAYLDPRPSSQQLSEYYGSGYFSGEKDFFSGTDYCEERDAAIARKAVTGYSEIVAEFDIRNKSILDIGCASGALLQLLKEHQPAKLVGIDLAEHPVVYGRFRYGLDLR